MCPSDHQVAAGCGLQFTDGGGVEMAFDSGVGSRDVGEGAGVHDFARRLPDTREVGHEVRLRRQRGVGLPDGHRLVQAPPVEERTHRP